MIPYATLEVHRPAIISFESCGGQSMRTGQRAAMTRSTALSLVVSLLLCACSSIDEQLEAPVDEVLRSEKPAGEVAYCLLEYNTGTLEEYNDGAYYIVWWENPYTGGVGLSFVVWRENAGSRIEVRNSGVVPGLYYSDACL
ncbi:MAG: hypothetical protein C0484_11310 [Rhodospirillum sp.]|jgi:hypothetical protein|nr:hypothetical protein [Rhodospirillum sp.]